MTQARRVRLVLRRIEPVTVLKFSLLLFASIYVVLMVAAGTLWVAASITGLRGNVESFIGDLIASDDFKFLGGQLLRASVIGGIFMVAAGSGLTVLLSLLHNLISDLVGGVGVVLEDDPAKPGPAKPVRATSAGTSMRERLAPRKTWGDPEHRPPAPKKGEPPNAKRPPPKKAAPKKAAPKLQATRRDTPRSPTAVDPTAPATDATRPEPPAKTAIEPPGEATTPDEKSSSEPPPTGDSAANGNRPARSTGAELHEDKGDGSDAGAAQVPSKSP